MKNISTLIICLLFAFVAKAQLPTIDTLYTIPYPASDFDSVKVVYSATFSSGGCDMLSDSIQTSGNYIHIDVKHCEGMLQYICTSTDTINLGVLAPGDYFLDLRLLLGSGDFGPCNNFIPKDSTGHEFHVSAMTSVPKIPGSVDLNIVGHQLIIHSKNTINNFSITDINGRIIYAVKEKITGNRIINLPNELSVGIYFISYNSASESVTSKFLFTGK